MSDSSTDISLTSSIANRVLSRRAVSALFVQVAAVGLAFLLQVALTNFLTVEAFGVYTFVFACVRIASLVTKLGLDSASLRFLPEYSASRNWGALRGYLIFGRITVGSFSLVVSIALLSVATAIRGSIPPSLWATLIFGALLLPIRAMTDLAAAVLRAFQRVTTALVAAMILEPLLLLALVILGSLTGVLDAPIAMGLTVTSTAAVLFLCDRLARNRVSRDVPICRPELLPRRWLRVALPLLLLSGFGLVMSRTDIVMLGALRGTTDAGFYAIGSRVSLVLLLGLSSINFVIEPLIAQLYFSGQVDSLGTIVRRATRAAFGFSLLLAIPLWIWATPLLGLFGSEYVVAKGALRVLLAAQLVNVSCGPVALLMSMTGHEHLAVRAFGGAVLLNVALNIVLIPMHGLVGAAIATTLSTATWNIVLMVAVWRRLGIVSLPA